MSETFVDLLDQFINELTGVFPDDAALKKWKTIFDTSKTVAPGLVVSAFMSKIEPLSEQIMGKDAGVFSDENALMRELGLSSMWKDPGMTDNTRECIWQYLQGLYMLGSNVAPVKDEKALAIESAIANVDAGAIQDVVKSVDANALQDVVKGVDMDAAMKVASSIDIGGLLAGGGDIGSILGGIDAQAAQDVLKSVDIDAALKLVQGLDIGKLLQK